jgi:hypothetical protein
MLELRAKVAALGGMLEVELVARGPSRNFLALLGVAGSTSRVAILPDGDSKEKECSRERE